MIDNEIFNIMDECFFHLSNIKQLNISDILNFNLDKICTYLKVDNGFIGEKQINSQNITYFRYYAFYGEMQLFLMDKLKKNGYIDFYSDCLMHHKIMENNTPVIINNIFEIKNEKLPNGHPEIDSYCLFPLLKNEELIGIIGFSKKNKIEFTNDDLEKIKILSKFISNVLINIRNVEELDTHKMSFIANMSHEIRTPLNSIITTIDMLQETTLNKMQTSFVDSIKTSGILLMDILNDILDYSKIINNGIKLKLIPLSINKCVSSVYTMLVQKANEKSLKFNYNIHNNVPDMIIADGIRLKQVLINVLTNAIKFTKRGEVLLNIECLKNENNNCELLIKIKDTGIGIAEEKIPKIFDAYKQIDNEYLNSDFGIGLGLSITKHIVNLYRGTINVSSQVGVGTEVSIKIPFNIFTEQIDADILVHYFSNKDILIFDTDVNERIMLFTQMREFKLKPILTSCIDEIIMYLSDNNYNFEFILINNNDLHEKDILKIQRIKNSSIKIIILDVENLNDKIIMYDYKLLRPIDTEKINYLLGILYTSAQYQTKSIHNEFLIEDKKTKISNINNITIEKLEKSNLKILVAEDNKENQLVLIELLHSLGYLNIELTTDGQETLMKMLETDYHVVLMDLKMPIMSGITVTQKFKEIRHTQTKIIAITASLSEEVKIKCFEAKMDGFITKPIDKKDLNTVLNIILNSFLNL